MNPFELAILKLLIRGSTAPAVLMLDGPDVEEERDSLPAVFRGIIGRQVVGDPHLAQGLDQHPCSFQRPTVGLNRTVLAMEGHPDTAPSVLTRFANNSLDERGHERKQEQGDLGGSDLLDGSGHLESSS